MKEKTCCFTGHRDIPSGAYQRIFKKTEDMVESLIKKGYGKYISILIYAYDGEVFARLESKKDKIENVFGENLDWYSSREKSVAKRIILRREADIYNPAEGKKIYSWMIERFDKLQEALGAVNEKYE